MEEESAKGIIEEDAKAIAGADLPWDKLNGKTVLISGANGYVPAYFVHGLIQRNILFGAKIKIVALCRSEERAKRRFSEYLNRDDFCLLIQDVCRPIAWEQRVDYFIHAASPASAAYRHSDCVGTYTANVLGCYNMLELSRKGPCGGFLLVSSADVYGDTNRALRFTEDMQTPLDGLNPRNAYALGKRGAESLCACYAHQYGIPAVIVRPIQLMGPGVSLDDGRLHIDFIAQMIKKDSITLKSDGSARRSFLYLSDAVVGMLKAMLLGEPGQAYNVADENGEASVLELAELMAGLCETRKITVEFDITQRNTPAVTQAPAATLVSAEKLRALGWACEYSLRDGARRMMKAYGV